LDVEEETRDGNVRRARSVGIRAARLLQLPADMFKQPVRDNETQLCPAARQRREHRGGRPGKRAKAAGDKRKPIGALTDDKQVRAIGHADGYPWKPCQDGPDLIWDLVAQLDFGMAHHSLQAIIQ
jgi:hypothetical protein